jgi:hypothetical protein
MARLVPNPIGDILPPLERIEAAVKELPTQLSDIRRLPQIHEELITLNEKLTAVVEALEGLRRDAAHPNGSVAAAAGEPSP